MCLLAAVADGQEVVAVPHGLHEDEGTVERERHDRLKGKLWRAERRARARDIGQDEREDGERGEHRERRIRALELKRLLAMSGRRRRYHCRRS